MSPTLQYGLAVYYLLVAAMNVGFAAYYHRYAEPRKPNVAFVWYAVAAVFALHSVAYFFKAGWVIPTWIREPVDWATGPTSYVMLSVIAFAALLYWRRFFVQPQVAWS